MTRWPTYPAYKDSGVAWLGEIPAHWSDTRLKYGYDVQLGKMLTPTPNTDEDTLENYLRSANVYWEGVDISDVKQMWFSPFEKAQYELSPGDLVVCEGGDVGRSAIWQGGLSECYIQNAVHRVRGKDRYTNKFLYYWLFALKHVGYIDLICSKATIAHLTAEKLMELPLVAPPHPEQRAIATFLDHETGKLDALTRTCERLLAVLEERRAALISHAVTKGLDPDVAMKDSEVPWLGEIPAHWEVGLVKFLANIQRGKFSHRPRNDPNYYDGKYPFIQTGDISSAKKYIRIHQQTLNERGFSVSKRFPKETLVMSIAANIGDLAILDFAACFPDSIVGIVPREHADKVFLYYSMIAMEKQMFTLATQNTQLNLNVEQIGQVLIAVPPLPEQRAIAAHLDRETAKLDALAAKVRAAIERLAEYRTVLISAAVTGKIDVRRAVGCTCT